MQASETSTWKFHMYMHTPSAITFSFHRVMQVPRTSDWPLHIYMQAPGTSDRSCPPMAESFVGLYLVLSAINNQSFVGMVLMKNIYYEGISLFFYCLEPTEIIPIKAEEVRKEIKTPSKE